MHGRHRYEGSSTQFGVQGETKAFGSGVSTWVDPARSAACSESIVQDPSAHTIWGTGHVEIAGSILIV